MEAWRRAQRVAVLADTPVYLWHSSATNNSKTYGPRDGGVLGPARRALRVHRHDARRRRSSPTRGARRCCTSTGPGCCSASAATSRRRARRSPRRRWPAPARSRSGTSRRRGTPISRSRSARGRSSSARTAPTCSRRSGTSTPTAPCRVTATEVAWRDGRLHLQLDRALARQERRPGRAGPGRRPPVPQLPPDVRAALPDDVVDFTDTLDRFRLDVGVRDRPASVTWQLQLDQEARWIDLERRSRRAGAHRHDGARPGDRRTRRTARRERARPRRVRCTGTARVGPARSATAVRRRRPCSKGARRSRTGRRRARSRSTPPRRLRNVIADGASPSGGSRASCRPCACRCRGSRCSHRRELPAAARLQRIRPSAGEFVLQGALVAETGGAHLDLAASGPVRPGRVPALVPAAATAGSWASARRSCPVTRSRSCRGRRAGPVARVLARVGARRPPGAAPDRPASEAVRGVDHEPPVAEQHRAGCR